MISGATLQKCDQLFDETACKETRAIGELICSGALFIIGRPTHLGFHIGQHFPETVIDFCIRKGVVVLKGSKESVQITRIIVLHDHALVRR